MRISSQTKKENTIPKRRTTNQQKDKFITHYHNKKNNHTTKKTQAHHTDTHFVTVSLSIRAHPIRFKFKNFKIFEMRRRYGRKRRSAEILSQNFQNDDDDDKMMKMSSQQKRRRDARLRVTNMMMERWRNDESRKTVRIFYSAFTLTSLQ